MTDTRLELFEVTDTNTVMRRVATLWVGPLGRVEGEWDERAEQVVRELLVDGVWSEEDGYKLQPFDGAKFLRAAARNFDNSSYWEARYVEWTNDRA